MSFATSLLCYGMGFAVFTLFKDNLTRAQFMPDVTISNTVKIIWYGPPNNFLPPVAETVQHGSEHCRLF